MLANGLRQEQQYPKSYWRPHGKQHKLHRIKAPARPFFKSFFHYYWEEATLHHPCFHPKSPVRSRWILCPSQPPSNLTKTSTPSLDYKPKPSCIVIYALLLTKPAIVQDIGLHPQPCLISSMLTLTAMSRGGLNWMWNAWWVLADSIVQSGSLWGEQRHCSSPLI